MTSQYCLHHFEVDDGRTLYNFCTLLFDSDARKLEGLFTKKRSISVEESSVIRVDDVIILFKAIYFHYVFEIFVAIFLMIINIEVTHNDNFFLFINYLFHVFVEKDIILFWLVISCLWRAITTSKDNWFRVFERNFDPQIFKRGFVEV